MRPKSTTTAILIAGLIQMSNPLGALRMHPGDVAFAEEGAAPRSAVTGLTRRFGKLYRPTRVEVKPAIPAYKLPLTPDRVGNYAHVMGKLRRSDAFARKLLANGVAAGFWQGEDFVKAYLALRKAELPVYVTSDSMLHLYHIQFDETLKHIEQTELIRQLEQLTGSVAASLVAQRTKAAPDTREAIDRALAFLMLGRRELTDTSAELADLRAYRAEVAADASWRFWEFYDVQQKRPLLYHAVSTDKQFDQRAIRRGDARQNMLRYLDARIKRLSGDTTDKSLALPERVQEWIAHDRAAMARHSGFGKSAIFHYDEDFSQYVPRGHYTRTYPLRRYFNAMMWYGRMTFLINGGSPHGPRRPFIVSALEARRQTAAAGFLTRALRSVKIEGQTAWQLWERIYGITAFFVGLADDLTAAEYDHAIGAALGKDYSPAALLDAAGWAKVKREVVKLRKPAIYSGTGQLQVPRDRAGAGSHEASVARTQGFRFMGQRFVPDSYVMGKLIYPTVTRFTGKAANKVFTNHGGTREFARGLDVMALLGSKRAAANLTASGDDQYVGYREAFDTLSKEFAELDQAGWNANLYWSWLYCLEGLLRDYPKGYQTYMRTDAWKDKQLTAALGSWAQLRHDTILYAKQPYGRKSGRPRQPKDFPGYVEPVPHFYGRLQALNRLTLEALSKMQVLDETTKKRLAETDKLLARLIAISVKELENRELSEEDLHWIKFFDSRLQRAVMGHGQEAMKTTLVADVLTATTGEVLEEATGKLGLVVVANRLPDGSIGLAVGPVFTYYEFKHPMKDRLTDEKWRTMLRAGPQADKMPAFTRSYFSTR